MSHFDERNEPIQKALQRILGPDALETCDRLQTMSGAELNEYLLRLHDEQSTIVNGLLGLAEEEARLKKQVKDLTADLKESQKANKLLIEYTNLLRDEKGVVSHLTPADEDNPHLIRKTKTAL